MYNTGDNVGLAAGYYFWNGNAWATIATAGGSGSFAASFVRGSRTASQSSIAVGGIVSFSAVDNTSGQDISLNTTNGKITLAPGNTYRLIAAVPNFSGSRPAFMWYNETSSSYIGSATNGYSPTDGAANAGAFGGLAEVVITPNVSTVLSFRLLSSQSSGAVTVGGLVDFSTTGSYPWFEAQVISGNAPVTGQSVEYGIARYTGTDGGSLTTGALVGFDATAPGNITWSGNKFTLKANKTYELESYLAIYQSVGWVAGKFQIYDYTNNVALANGLFMSMQGAETYNPNANGLMRAIVTPASDIQVGIKFVSFSGATYAPGLIGSANTVTSAAPNQCYFLAKQIGSSAIVNPWTLSGTNTFNTTGNVGIGNNAPAATLDVTGSLGVSGAATFRTTGGDEGGEIEFGVPQTNTTLSTRVVADVWQNRFRIFDGNTKGVYIDLSKAPTGVGGELLTKASGIVNRGVDVTLGNLKARIAATGNISLQLSTVSGTYSIYGSGIYSQAGTVVGATIDGGSPRTISTTPSYLVGSYSFGTAGSTDTWVLMDTSNSIAWRITMVLGAGVNNNLITIERLF